MTINILSRYFTDICEMVTFYDWIILCFHCLNSSCNNIFMLCLEQYWICLDPITSWEELISFSSRAVKEFVHVSKLKFVVSINDFVLGQSNLGNEHCYQYTFQHHFGRFLKFKMNQHWKSKTNIFNEMMRHLKLFYNYTKI